MSQKPLVLSLRLDPFLQNFKACLGHKQLLDLHYLNKPHQALLLAKDEHDVNKSCASNWGKKYAKVQSRLARNGFILQSVIGSHLIKPAR